MRGTVCYNRSQGAATTGNISVGVDRIHRVHQVSVNGTNSEWTNVTCGIPQRSVLGPIMFVSYINGLPNRIVWMSIIFLRMIRLIVHVNSIHYMTI